MSLLKKVLLTHPKLEKKDEQEIHPRVQRRALKEIKKSSNADEAAYKRANKSQ